MTRIITLHGTDTAACDGREVKTGRGSPICALSRELIAAGADASEAVTVMRGNTVCFRGTSLGWWADRTVTEGDAPVRFGKYAPMPERAFSGAAQ